LSSSLRIGVDLDNTLVCYDHVFHRVALEQRLIPSSLPVSKSSVRDHLRSNGIEERWTQLQGYVYGARIMDASAFGGALHFLRRAMQKGVSIFIVSHKTRYPCLGPQFDLHQAALDWLDKNGVFDLTDIGLSRGQVFLEQWKQDKLQRIGSLDCTHFIDDMPELLSEPGFPKGVEKILFDPNNEHSPVAGCRRMNSWHQIERELLAA